MKDRELTVKRNRRKKKEIENEGIVTVRQIAVGLNYHATK